MDLPGLLDTEFKTLPISDTLKTAFKNNRSSYLKISNYLQSLLENEFCILDRKSLKKKFFKYHGFNQANKFTITLYEEFFCVVYNIYATNFSNGN
jgi:hypothetical protein